MKKLFLCVLVACSAVATVSMTSCTATRVIKVSDQVVSCEDGRCDTVSTNFVLSEQYKGVTKK